MKRYAVLGDTINGFTLGESSEGELLRVEDVVAWLNSILADRTVAPRFAVRVLLEELE